MLSYHFKIPHPEQLTNEEWGDKWQQLRWVLWYEAKRYNAKPDESIQM